MGLIVIGAVAVTAMVLSERGVWFQPATAAAIYRLLWVVLWLPGIAFCAALFRRTEGWLRVAVAVGALLQGAALVQDPASGGTALGGALGFLGLGLPFFGWTRATLRRNAPLTAYTAAMCVLVYVVDAWPVAAVCVVWLWVPYAVAIWPSVGDALREAEESHGHRKERSAAYRLFWGMTNGLLILIALAALGLMIAYVVAVLHWHRVAP